MKIIINVALAFVTAVACLILAEIGLRIWGVTKPRPPQEYYEKSPIPELPYIAKANVHEGDFRTNSHHLRDSEIPLAKPPGTLRVAMVGNSMTIGHAVKQDELYTEVMERDLNSRFQGRPKVDVLNAGQQGYSIVHFMPFTREFVYPYQPDIILYQFCWNDIESSSLMRIRNVPDQAPKSGLARFLTRYSHLFGNLMKLRDLRKFAQNLLVMYDDSLALRGFYQDLFAWADSTRERNVPFAVVIFPTVVETIIPEKYPDVTREFIDKKGRIMEACRQHGLLVCDLTDSLRMDYGKNHQILYADFSHFNARGHELAARVIEGWLLRQPEFRNLAENAVLPGSPQR